MLAAGVEAGAAAGAAMVAAGCFAPLTGALARLQDAVQSRSARLATVVGLEAGALRDSAGTYEADDQSASGTMQGLEFGGSTPPPGGR